jgi:single-strand DNA-binding protein
LSLPQERITDEIKTYWEGAIIKKTANKKTIMRKLPKNSDVNEYVNQVSLIGRLSGEPFEKVLPSGDKVVEFRVVIERGTNSVKDKRKVVDTIDVAAWSALNRKVALKLDENSWVYVFGSIRRRFWQSPAGLASRWQVEASDISTL